MSILVGAHDDADNVNDLPDEEAPGRNKLNDAGDNLAGVKTMQSSKAKNEKETGEDEGYGARTGG